MRKAVILIALILVFVGFFVCITNYIYNAKYEANEIKSYDCCDVPLDKNGNPQYSVFAPCSCNNIFEKTLIVLGIM